MDQLGHLIRHISQQGGEQTPFRYGHIATYDPDLHRVRCIIPSMTDQDGNPTLSPWMPLGTLSAGAGFGMQVHYQGGATITNPTGGEQVLVAVFDRQRGVSAVPCTFYHANALPPSTNLPTMADGYSAAAGPSEPGDIVISTPPAAGTDPNNTAGGANSFVRLRKDGTIQIWSAGQVSANIIGGLNAVVNTGDVDLTVAKGSVNATVSAGDVTANITGNATVTASGVVSIFASAVHLSRSAGANLMQLCTSAMALMFNVHTHGNGGPPNQQAGQPQLTQSVAAE